MSLIRKSLLTVVGTGVLTLCNLGIGVLLARGLSPDGLGQYALIASTASMLGILGSLGLGGATIYYINNRGMDLEIATTLAVRTSLLTGAALMIALAVAVRYETYFGAVPALVPVAVGVLVLGKTFVPATMYLFMAAMEVLKYVDIQVTPSLVLLALAALLALVDQLTIGPVLWAAAAGQLAGVGIVLAFVRADLDWRRPFQWSELQPLLTYGILINLTHFIYMGGPAAADRGPG